MPQGTALNKIHATNPGMAILAGSFTTFTAGETPTTTGNGYTVARTAAGKYKITLSKKYPKLVAAEVKLQMATPDGAQATPGPWVQASKTLEIWTLTNANAVADIATAANNVVHFVLYLATHSAIG